MLACGGRDTTAGGWENEDVLPSLEVEWVFVFEKVGYCIGVDVAVEPFVSEWGITGGVRGVYGETV